MPGRQVGPELQRHRPVLGGVHVALEEGPAEVGGVEPQPRGAAALGAEAAELHADRVFPGRSRRWRSRASRAPLLGTMSARTLSSSPRVGQLPRDVVADAHRRGRPAGDLGLRPGPERQGLVQDRLGRREVLLDVRRREREHGADPLEPLPVGVFGQAGGVARRRRSRRAGRGSCCDTPRARAGGTRPSRPVAAWRAASASAIRAAIHSATRATSSAFGRGSFLGGGISPELIRSMISAQRPPFAGRRSRGRACRPGSRPSASPRRGSARNAATGTGGTRPSKSAGSAARAAGIASPGRRRIMPMGMPGGRGSPRNLGARSVPVGVS